MEAQFEAYIYHTLTDAEEVINLMGLEGFLKHLFEDKTKRELTIEELEAMRVLHEGWEL